MTSKSIAPPGVKSRLSAVKSGPIDNPLRCLFYGSEGVGKAQPLSAEVLTPNGFTPIGNLETGSQVVGADGRPTTVLGVYPQGEREVFHVTMTDGTRTRCCNEHLWLTTKSGESAPQVRSLGEIRETLTRKVSGEKAPPSGRYPVHRIPVTLPIEGEWKDTPIHPYVMGALLGDGVMAGGSVTFHKPEIDVQERIRICLGQDRATPYSDGKSLRIKSQSGKETSQTKNALAAHGLEGARSHEKFIPLEYLQGNLLQRTELLRGLCDTDGHVIHTGSRVEYSTTSDQLCRDISHLARSLGGIVTSRKVQPTYTSNGEKKEGKPAHRIMLFFPHGLCPVSSDKHLARWQGIKAPTYRSIAEIEPAGTEECVCIRVEAEDSLYITDDFIVTHNSTLAAAAPAPILFDIEGGADHLDVARYPFHDGESGHVPQSLADVISGIRDLRTAEHDWKTLILDTITGLEPLIWDHVCSKYSGAKGAVNKTGKTLESIAEIDFQGGYKVAADEVKLLCGALDLLRLSKRMNIIILGHSIVRPFKNPLGDDFDRIELSIHKTSAGILRQWVDVIGYCAFEEGADKEDARARAKGFSTGRRLIHFERSAAWDAKSRIPLPPQMEMSVDDAWKPFAEAIKRGKGLTAQELVGLIEAELNRIEDEDLANKVHTAMSHHPDASTLSRYLADLRERPEGAQA